MCGGPGAYPLAIASKKYSGIHKIRQSTEILVIASIWFIHCADPSCKVYLIEPLFDRVLAHDVSDKTRKPSASVTLCHEWVMLSGKHDGLMLCREL